MSAVIEKRVSLSEDHAALLRQIAGDRCLTEDAVIGDGIELLHRICHPDRHSDLSTLIQLVAECDSLPAYRTRKPLNTEDIRYVVGTPIDPSKIRASEETY